MGAGRGNCCRHHHLPAALVWRRLATAFVCLTLIGCSLSALTRPDHYRVERGDTLYSIATRYDLNWREVARWNGIGPPYRLEVGQRLSLERYPEIAYPASGSAPRSAPQSQTRAPTPSSTAPESGATVKRPGAGVRVQKLPREPAEKPAPSGQHRWQWPTRGPVLRTYAQTRPRHGIDIGGDSGDDVVAADGGRVVYSGAGLKGYGKLVIIKHDARYLTAYGMNSRLLVEQGDAVKAGDKIAEKGLGPRNQPTLHFELRRDGQPVDPMQLLPRR